MISPNVVVATNCLYRRLGTWHEDYWVHDFLTDWTAGAGLLDTSKKRTATGVRWIEPTGFISSAWTTVYRPGGQATDRLLFQMGGTQELCRGASIPWQRCFGGVAGVQGTGVQDYQISTD